MGGWVGGEPGITGKLTHLNFFTVFAFPHQLGLYHSPVHWLETFCSIYFENWFLKKMQINIWSHLISWWWEGWFSSEESVRVWGGWICGQGDANERRRLENGGFEERKKEEGFQTTGKQWDLVQQINSQSLEEASDQKSLWPSNLTPSRPNFRHGQPWH